MIYIYTILLYLDSFISKTYYLFKYLRCFVLIAVFTTITPELVTSFIYSESSPLLYKNLSALVFPLSVIPYQAIYVHIKT